MAKRSSRYMTVVGSPKSYRFFGEAVPPLLDSKHRTEKWRSHPMPSSVTVTERRQVIGCASETPRSAPGSDPS